MEKNIKKAIESYQCPGCSVGGSTKCFKDNTDGGVGCGDHFAGTILSHIGKIFLGMPKGFNRLGTNEKLKPLIFEKYESSGYTYDMWNVPTWKYLNKDGHTLVRGMMPRLNRTFLHIFLEDCLDKVDCREITEEDLNNMD